MQQLLHIIIIIVYKYSYMLIYLLLTDMGFGVDPCMGYMLMKIK